MNSFFLSFYSLGHLVIAIIESLFLLFAYPFFRLSQRNLAMIVLPLVLVSTIYDNLILWSGHIIGYGELLESLSQIRFLLHYLFVPLLIVVAIELAYLSESKIANQFVRISSWLLAFGLAGFDIFNDFVGLELKPETFVNVLRYIPVLPQIPIITIIINIFVLLVGILIWVNTKNWQWLCIASIISLIGNAFPSAQVGTLLGSASECFLCLGLLLTQYNFEDKIDELESTDTSCPEGWQYVEYSGYQIFWKEKPKFTIYQTGSHEDGDFIRIYVPKCPYKEKDDDGNIRIKIVTYLHGFALCLPRFYKKHLEQLASEGYYIFFPDYQKSDYPNFTSDDETYLYNYLNNTDAKNTIKQMKRNKPFRYWLSSTGYSFLKLIFRRKVNEPKLQNVVDQGILKVLGSLFFVVVVNIFYLFNRQYGKNLISMITTVIESLTNSPMEWLSFAVNSTTIGWDKLCEHSKQSQQPDLDLSQQEIDFYVFGHSLGGLLALSWPYYLKQNPDKSLSDTQLRRFYPKQIITSDPSPDTALGIPPIALWILGIFRFPFATQPLKIEQTGMDLTTPVGILHGNDDKIVPPTKWLSPPLFQRQGAFFNIASTEKKIYFSQSDIKDNLKANHNQSVTDTTYYGDGFMSNFGGAKSDPDAYNLQYIWPAVSAVIKNQVQANKLKDKDGFHLHDFEVLDEPKL